MPGFHSPHQRRIVGEAQVVTEPEQGCRRGVLVFGGYSELPFVGLALGMVGAAAVVAISALMSKSHAMSPLRYIGQNSIVIYLAFFLPMAVTRTLLLKSDVISDIGTISLLVTAVAVVVPILVFRLVKDTRLRFLFERPAFARLAPRTSPLAAAE